MDTRKVKKNFVFYDQKNIFFACQQNVGLLLSMHSFFSEILFFILWSKPKIENFVFFNFVNAGKKSKGYQKLGKDLVFIMTSRLKYYSIFLLHRVNIVPNYEDVKDFYLCD